MHLTLFLVCGLALCCAVGACLDLSAGQRGRDRRAARRSVAAAAQGRRVAIREARAARRCGGEYSPTPATNVNPYDGGVEPLGPPVQVGQKAAVVEELQPPPEEPQTEEKAKAAPEVTAPADPPQQDQAAVEPPSLPAAVDLTAIWRPDPPVVPAGPQSAIPVLDQ